MGVRPFIIQIAFIIEIGSWQEIALFVEPARHVEGLKCVALWSDGLPSRLRFLSSVNLTEAGDRRKVQDGAASAEKAAVGKDAPDSANALDSRACRARPLRRGKMTFG